MNAPPFHIATPEELITLRQQLRDNGYHPIPVRGKVPGLTGWQNCTNVSPETIQQWSRSLRNATNTGILTGPIAGVDIDVLDAAVSEKLVVRAVELLGPSPLRRIGRAPKTLLLYRMEASHAKIATPDLFFGNNPTNKDAKAKVEILLVGQQVVVHGIHPDTRAPYHWTDRSPFDTPANEAPLVTPEPRLRNHTSDHQLGAYLKEQGCDNTKKVLRRQGWTFPSLSQCRKDWEKRFPNWPWRDPNLKAWRSDEQADEYGDDDCTEGEA